jgi:hypothetical protein
MIFIVCLREGCRHWRFLEKKRLHRSISAISDWDFDRPIRYCVRSEETVILRAQGLSSDTLYLQVISGHRNEASVKSIIVDRDYSNDQRTSESSLTTTTSDSKIISGYLLGYVHFITLTVRVSSNSTMLWAQHSRFPPLQ